MTEDKRAAHTHTYTHTALLSIPEQYPTAIPAHSFFSPGTQQTGSYQQCELYHLHTTL